MGDKSNLFIYRYVYNLIKFHIYLQSMHVMVYITIITPIINGSGLGVRPAQSRYQTLHKGEGGSGHTLKIELFPHQNAGVGIHLKLSCSHIRMLVWPIRCIDCKWCHENSIFTTKSYGLDMAICHDMPFYPKHLTCWGGAASRLTVIMSSPLITVYPTILYAWLQQLECRPDSSSPCSVCHWDYPTQGGCEMQQPYCITNTNVPFSHFTRRRQPAGTPPPSSKAQQPTSLPNPLSLATNTSNERSENGYL